LDTGLAAASPEAPAEEGSPEEPCPSADGAAPL